MPTQQDVFSRLEIGDEPRVTPASPFIEDFHGAKSDVGFCRIHPAEQIREERAFDEIICVEKLHIGGSNRGQATIARPCSSLWMRIHNDLDAIVGILSELRFGRIKPAFDNHDDGGIDVRLREEAVDSAPDRPFRAIGGDDSGDFGRRAGQLSSASGCQARPASSISDRVNSLSAA